MPTRLEKYLFQSGRGDGQGKATDSQPGFTIAGKLLEIDRPDIYSTNKPYSVSTLAFLLVERGICM